MDAPSQLQMLPSSCYYASSSGTSVITTPGLPSEACTSWSASLVQESISPTSPAHETSVSTSPTSPTFCSGSVTRGNVIYQASEVRSMATELARARKDGEFPLTTTSPMDAQAAVADYESLLQLRQLRGDLCRPASGTYTRFHVETARRIKERDAVNDELETKKEIVRRMDSYLRSVQKEKQHFDASKAAAAAASSPQRRGSDNSAQVDLAGIGEEIYSIIEDVAEHTIASAAGPLRLNVGNLQEQTAGLGRLLRHQRKTNTALVSDLKDQLVLTIELVQSLSQIVADLPAVVNSAVQAQAQDHVRVVLEEQPRMLAEPRGQSQQSVEGEGRRARFPTAAGDVGFCGKAKLRCPRVTKSKGGMRRMINRVFRVR